MSALYAPIIIGIGELVWDCLPSGARLGGAPANLCAHASALGARSMLVAAVGADPDGDRMLDELRERGVDTRFVARREDLPTGKVTVEIDELRHHTFAIGSPAAWDAPVITPEILAAAAAADAIIFGTLGQRTLAARKSTGQLLAACGANTLRVCDANFRPPYDDHELLRELLKSTDVLKINDDELAAFAPDDTPESFFEKHPGLSYLVYTRGAGGALLLARAGGNTISSDLPAPPTEVVDTIGAGDSYTATFLTGLFAGLPLDEINRRALCVAAYVCTQPGATPDLAPVIGSLATS